MPLTKVQFCHVNFFRIINRSTLPFSCWFYPIFDNHPKYIVLLKKLVFSLFIFFAFLSLSAQTVKVYVSDSIQQRDDKQFYIHTVLQGQTVYSIAKAYNVSVDEIYFENPEAKEGISVDQFLWIPTVNKETELSKELKSVDFEFFYHLVKPNETFNQIAKNYNIPVSYILKVNPEIHEPLREGEYIKIPSSETFDISSDEEVVFNPDLPVIPNFRHTVTPGETLYSISKRYDVTVSQIRAVNPGMAATLEIGDRLRIPQSGVEIAEEVVKEEPEKPQQPEFYNHRVKRKETLYSISRLYGVTLQDLYASNPGLTPSIDEGQTIKVPFKTIDKSYIIYTAGSKTRLNKIAKLYNVSVSKIEKENPSLRRRILPGQKVRIPVGTKANVLEEEEEPLPDEELAEEQVKEEIEVKPVLIGCEKRTPVFDRVFKVALMVPFYLEELDSLDRAQFMIKEQDGFTPFRFVNFYEGALIAIDSLKKQGYAIRLFVYDVDQSLTKTAKVLQNPELRKMDLIIGPFQSKSFDQVALFAGNFNIPIVNPFSFRDEIIEKYRTAIKVKSDTKYQAELVASLVAEDYKNAKVFLITHTAYENVEEVNMLAEKVAPMVTPNFKVPNTDLYNLAVEVAFRDEEFEGDGPLPNYTFEGREIFPELLAENIEDSTQFESQLIRMNYMKDSLYPLFENASPFRTNLAIVYGESKAFVMDVMNRLNEHRDTFDIKLIAMPSIERLNNLDEIQSNNMNLTYFSTNYVDYNANEVQDFIFKFREQFKTDPGLYGFTGFDLTYYFVENLVNLDFRLRNCLDQYPGKMLFNTLKIEEVPRTGNYVNSYWNVIRYKNYSLIKLPDPVPVEKSGE